jgi:enoyl-CoA hydratase
VLNLFLAYNFPKINTPKSMELSMTATEKPTYETILTEVRENVGVVRLNRPQVRNALNRTLIIELVEALEAFDSDASVGAIVISGDERAFAAGADIKEMAGASAVEMLVGDHITA